MTAILVTRPGGEVDPLTGALGAAGYRVYAVPTAVTQPLDFERPATAGYDWVLVTSASGVNALAEFPPGPRWAAVGSATAQALRARGIQPDLIPDEANGLALANALPDVQAKRVLLVRASAAASDLPERLRQRGAVVDDLAAYRTVEGPGSAAEPLKVALADVDLVAIVFASGSAIRGFIALGATPAWPAVTIGPRTSGVARQCGFRVIAEAASQNTEGLVAAVVRAIPVEERNRA